MKLSRKQRTAVQAARRIRANLVRMRNDTDLGGDCGLASMMLAAAIDDIDSLRHTCATLHGYGARWAMTHVWNDINGLILDITATQFNDGFGEFDPTLKAPLVRGVLVTTAPRFYHRPLHGRGMATVEFALNGLVDRDRYGRVDRLLQQLEVA